MVQVGFVFGQEHCTGKHPSEHTLRHELHQLDYVWKRPRYALHPDPELRGKKETASPPLAKPGLAAVHDRSDILDRLAGEAQVDGALPGREFVSHGVLRRAAPGSCLR